MENERKHLANTYLNSNKKAQTIFTTSIKNSFGLYTQSPSNNLKSGNNNGVTRVLSILVPFGPFSGELSEFYFFLFVYRQSSKVLFHLWCKILVFYLYSQQLISVPVHCKDTVYGWSM